jgi:hypothetical protein
MLQRMFVVVPVVIAMVGLVAGCAGPSSSASDSVSASVAPASDLGGTWSGSFGQLAASHYEDEGTVVLQINEDGTFTAAVARGGGTNNLAKPSTWAGTVVTNGNHITLRNSHGPWPWIRLTRSGDNTLYGIANDPATEAHVLLKFEREGTQSSSRTRGGP